jgi:hypothetical protein
VWDCDRLRPRCCLEVLQQLLQANETQRDQVTELLTRLRRQPFMQGEFREADDTGSTNEVILAGDVLVFFWADHAVKTIRVAKLEFVASD